MSECICGNKEVNDKGVCETCHFHHKGFTVDSGVAQVDLLWSLILYNRIHGIQSTIEEMVRRLDELRWVEKE